LLADDCLILQSRSGGRARRPIAWIIRAPGGLDTQMIGELLLQVGPAQTSRPNGDRGLFVASTS
jgi:hypothetical protein